jgi:hypothetical protein
LAPDSPSAAVLMAWPVIYLLEGFARWRLRRRSPGPPPAPAELSPEQSAATRGRLLGEVAGLAGGDADRYLDKVARLNRTSASSAMRARSPRSLPFRAWTLGALARLTVLTILFLPQGDAVRPAREAIEQRLAGASAVTGHRHGPRSRTLLGTFGRVTVAEPRTPLETPASERGGLRCASAGCRAADALRSGGQSVPIR